MKKFTSFMLMLLCAVTTFAAVNEELKGKQISAIGNAVTEITEGNWYILNNVGRGNYVSQENNAMKMRATNNCVVGNYAEDKAGYLFKITKASDKHYNIVSGNGVYFSLGWNSSAVSETPVNYLIGHQNAESAPTVFYLYDDDNKRAADGQESGNSFVGWSDAIPTSTTGNDSYCLLPVNLEAAASTDFTALNSAIANANSVLTNAGYTFTMGESVELQIVDASRAGYLSVSHDACDSDVLANVIDGELGTLYHSSWIAAAANPYMQVDLGEGESLQAFALNYNTRQSGNNAAPYAITVSASNNGEDFTTITELKKNDAVNAIPSSNGKSYSSIFVADKAYRYLRFTVTSSPNGNNSFGLAEFGITKISLEGAMTGTKMRYATLYKAVLDATAVVGTDVRQDVADAAVATLNNYVTLLTAPACPFDVTTDIENPVLYYIKSARTEQNWNNPYWTLSGNAVAITEFENEDALKESASALWFFVEDDKTGLLTMHSYDGAAMGYKAVAAGADKLTNASDQIVGLYYQLVVKEGDTSFPYALKPYGYNNYVSNHGGRNNNIGFYNNLDDSGTRFALTPATTDDIIPNVEINWTTSTEWEEIGGDIIPTVIYDNKLADGVKSIEQEFTVNKGVTATAVFQYTGGSCALNVRGIEVVDAGGYIVAADYHVGKTGTNSTGNEYTVKIAEAGDYKLRCYATFDSNNRANATNGTVTVSFATAEASEFTHNVTFAAEYATLYLGYKVAIPAGVEAYVVSEVGEYAVLAQVSGIIPANTGVILKNVGSETTYTFNYTAESVDQVESKYLDGTIANCYVAQEAYVLGIQNKKVGLYKASLNQLDGTAFLNNANKVYMVLTDEASAAASYSFSFDWNGTTGIENIDAAVSNTANGKIYDITGREIKAITTPGIYIVDGKKVVVK